MTLHDACGKSIVKVSIPLNPLLRREVITFGGSGQPKAFPPVAHDYIPKSRRCHNSFASLEPGKDHRAAQSRKPHYELTVECNQICPLAFFDRAVFGLDS
jgi:hypothetical protein